MNREPNNPSRYVSRLIVGLGNPGRRYVASRHNVGFQAAERLVAQSGAVFSAHARVPALVAEWRGKGLRWIVLKPVTFMNLSGQAVAAAINYWKFPIESLLVILDDAELDPGELRLRGQGSSGGHNGLNSIIEHLGTRQFTRLRIGIGRPSNPNLDLAEWVLKSFEKTELLLLEGSLTNAVRAIKTWAGDSLEVAMNQYNNKQLPPSRR